MLFLLRPIARVVLVSRICAGVEEEGFGVGFMFCAAALPQTMRQRYVKGTFPALERKISNMFVFSHKNFECNSQKSLTSLPCASHEPIVDENPVELLWLQSHFLSSPCSSLAFPICLQLCCLVAIAPFQS